MVLIVPLVLSGGRMFYVLLLLGVLAIFFSATAGWLLAKPVRSEKRFLLIILLFTLASFSWALNNILMIRNNVKNMEARINPQNQSPVAVVSEK